MDNSNTNLLIFAIQEERIDTIRFILKCGVPVGEDILQTAIETDNAEIIELFVDRMKTELPVRNFLAEAKSVETAKWLNRVSPSTSPHLSANCFHMKHLKSRRLPLISRNAG